jgi:hypothetical protein
MCVIRDQIALYSTLFFWPALNSLLTTSVAILPVGQSGGKRLLQGTAIGFRRRNVGEAFRAIVRLRRATHPPLQRLEFPERYREEASKQFVPRLLGELPVVQEPEQLLGPLGPHTLDERRIDGLTLHYPDAARRWFFRDHVTFLDFGGRPIGVL